jgi:hypothetical protein
MGKSHWLKMITMAEGKKTAKQLAIQGDGRNVSHTQK